MSLLTIPDVTKASTRTAINDTTGNVKDRFKPFSSTLTLTRSMSISIKPETMANHTIGGVWKYEQSANNKIPDKLPSRSIEYAVSRLGIALNARPSTCPGPTITRAIITNIKPASTSTGMMNSGFGCASAPKKTTSAFPLLSATSTYRSSRERKAKSKKPVSMDTAKTAGVVKKCCRVERALKQPIDMPTNEASKTVFVKNVRNSTWAGNQRIHASSRNRIIALTR